MKIKLDASLFKKILPNTGSVVTQLTSLLASKATRWTLIGIAILTIGYLGQREIWVPLQEKATLPAGASGVLSADVTVLQDINAQRAERAQHIPHDFSREARLIVPKATSPNGAN